MKTKHLVTYNFITIHQDATVREVLQSFLDYRQDIACVVEEKKLIGIVTKYSLYRWLLDHANLEANIIHCIKRDVVTLLEEESVYYAKDLLVKENIGHAVVLNKYEDVVGIISKSELIKGFISERQNLVNRLQTLMNNLQESVLSVDTHLHVTSYNTSALTILHKTKSELTGQPITQTFPQIAANLRAVIRTKEIIKHKRLSIGDNTLIASFIPLKEWDTITGAMVVLKDITDFEYIADELETTKKLENMLDNALEVAYDGVVMIDNERNITKANKEFLSLIGISNSSSILGTSIDTVAPELTNHKHTIHSEKIVGELITIQGKKAILTQTPIYQDEQQVGTIIKLISKQLDVWKDLLSHLEKLEHELTYYKESFTAMGQHAGPFAHIVSKSSSMEELKQKALIAARSFSNILITGKSGTGKELIADGIHSASGRTGKFIKINCAAIPEELLESEIFGYSDGAFTGAKKGGKPGKFELAHEGTLFLDEIGDMPMTLQAKLLRILQEKEFERVGGTETIKVDTRIIAATNQDPAKLIAEGTFREDLYYRINVIQLHIPPLSERQEDIQLLCDHFIKKFNTKTNRDVIGISQEHLEKLLDYEWPGNVRQLENVLERAYHFSTSKWIDPEHIVLEKSRDPEASDTHKPPNERLDREKKLQETEKNMLIQALKNAGGNRTKAAKLLGMSRSSFYNKLKKYEVKEATQFM
ncbi:CBS domain-containing protein [Pontibacillus yanchengensis]|uniref:CBS domain-containing protein n=2 Tax=Pontibacillus yanchengensis TaxID=462910 RepID=A0A6I4ZPH1_9BACI|nr:sigma-54-dependent Fis family transcriptional regulator [Pontibacillus yanchengensis]MYL32088.1 CBS domain-containing protein [Pontibacillus yanchengensis]MYL52668.1 CBS domain-containing protein [Pontibacillus yanchengensis]